MFSLIYNDSMNLEILIPAHMLSDKGTFHYRRVGELHPLCSQRRTDWRIIKLRDRMINYANYQICVECGEQKRQFGLCTIG